AQIASPCESIVTGQVKLIASGADMRATFTPKFGLGLNAAANLCGYDHFNWYQRVTRDPFPPSSRNNPNAPLRVPYPDPPTGGCSFKPTHTLPFYWRETGNELGEVNRHITKDTTLDFLDRPVEPKLKPGQSMAFTTALVGVLPDNSWEALYAWTWTSNFNG